MPCVAAQLHPAQPKLSPVCCSYELNAHTSQTCVAARHCHASFADTIKLLQAENDQQEDAPSLGLFAAKLYLYLGELKFAKLDMCAPVLGASRRLTSCTSTPHEGSPFCLEGSRGSLASLARSWLRELE